jgi:hypothetical protein
MSAGVAASICCVIAHPIPEPPMTQEQLYDAMVHLGTAN